MVNALWVRFDGEPLDRLGLGYSSPEYSTSFGSPGGGGCEEAEITLSAKPGYRSTLLYEGAYMEVMLGSSRMFSGIVDSIDRDTWAIHARGLAKEADHVLCLDAVYQTTTIVDVAIFAAVNRGLIPQWKEPNSISAVAYGSSAVSEAPNYLNTLLDGVAEAAGKWWTLWADGIIRLESLPTTPTYHLFPKAIDLPISYEESASDIILRYVDNGTHAGATASWLVPSVRRKELAVDATPLGEIPNAQAGAIAHGIVLQGKPKPGYTASLEVSRWTMLGPNLGPIDPRRVRAGEMVRLHGVSDPVTHEGHHDFVIGRTKLGAGGKTLQIDPMGLITNGSQEDVIAKILAAAWDEKFKG